MAEFLILAEAAAIFISIVFAGIVVAFGIALLAVRALSGFLGMIISISSWMIDRWEQRNATN